MSCLDVMYQPYSAYLPSYRNTDELFKKYANHARYDALQPKVEVDNSSGEQAQSTVYLSSNCVVYSYFSGDASAVVDEHFNRALSQPSFSPEHPGNKPGQPWKDVTPFPTHRSCLTSTLWQTSPAQYMQQDVADSYLTAPTFLQHSHTQQDTSASWLQHYSLPHYYTRLHYPALHHHRPAPPPTPCWQNYDTQTPALQSPPTNTANPCPPLPSETKRENYYWI